MARQSFLWPGLVAGVMTAGGCYEVPPIIPQGYVGGPTARGWPPVTAYHLEPFHPRNRWFQRAFGGRDGQGGLLPVHADEPLGTNTRFSLVDRAELCALLEAVTLVDNDRAGSSGLATADSRQGVTEAIFRSDLLAEASRLRSQGLMADEEKELVSSLLRVARSVGEEVKCLDGGLPPEAEPPPLRTGEWLDAEATAVSNVPFPPSLLPSTADMRWTRVLEEKPAGSFQQRLVLLRLRVALDQRGEPLLLSIGSECWQLWGDGKTVSHLWRFDRAEWLSGREPWREVPVGGEIITPGVPVPAEAFSQAYTRVLDPGRKAVQLLLVKNALRPLLELSSGSPAK